jgi:hypothetical protein
MEENLEKIRAARQSIWTEEPAEVKRLPGIKAAWNQGASTILFATTKLVTLITFLNHMRGIARQGGVDLETMKTVTTPYLEFHAAVFGNHYRFAEAAQVIRWAKEGLPNLKTLLPNLKTLAEYATLIEELAIYLNRLDYWVDLRIPWAKFGQVFEREQT